MIREGWRVEDGGWGIDAEEFTIRQMENINWKFSKLKYIHQQFTCVKCLKANNSIKQL